MRPLSKREPAPVLVCGSFYSKGAVVVANNSVAFECATACDPVGCTDPKKECTDDLLLLWLCPKSCQRAPHRAKTHLIETLNYLPGDEADFVDPQPAELFVPLF